MKNILKIILSFFAVCLFTFAFVVPLNPAGNWYQQFLPNIGSQQINDVYFIDSLTGFIVTSKNVNPDTSSILKTTNGGDNWLIVTTLAPRRFTRVKFINSFTGFISGGSGSGTPYLYKSIDGGSNWSPVTGATLGTALWNDMHVLNNDTIWLVDANSLNGGVFRTTNGGNNWIQQANFGVSNPAHIYMYNARIGFIDGLRKTTDGGSSWTIIAGEPPAFTDMYFSDSLTGWKCNVQMKKTTNGGLNWSSQTLPTGGIILTSSMLKFTKFSKDTIFGVGSEVFYGAGQFRGTILRTTNGGNNWHFQVPDTIIHSVTYRYIQFIDKSKGWAYWPVSGIHTTLGGDPTWLTAITQISNEVPIDFKLYQNYPNPFNPSTNIKYEVMKSSFISLIVYDVTGKKMLDLVNRDQTAGTYQVDFSGNGLSSGVYFYALFANGLLFGVKKMILLK